MGWTKKNQEILYVDGFAGPGKYKNYDEGSPVAALKAAESAIATAGDKWEAGTIHCVFIEADKKRFGHLKEEINRWDGAKGIKIYPLEMTFQEGLAVLQKQLPQSFQRSHPLFVFIDPFGATGVPFSCVSEILKSSCSEVLINLDADGIARIFLAEDRANYGETLNSIFGDSSWKALPGKEQPFPILCRAVLDLYKIRLRSLPKIRFVFTFEMQTSAGTLNYFLVFASQHPRGLAKMKEAMKTLDQAGNFCFADGNLHQPSLFRFDDPSIYSVRLLSRFKGQAIPYDVLEEFALNETPFVNPKGMLKHLEVNGLIQVLSRDSKRRRGTFSQTENLRIRFQKGDADG